MRGLLHKYSRAKFRIHSNKEKCLLLNYFTKAAGPDSEEESTKPTKLQSLYYRTVRSPLYFVSFVFCSGLSVAIASSEFLIFKNLSLEPVFKALAGKMDYPLYFVGASDAGGVLGAVLLRDQRDIQDAVRAGARGLLRALRQTHRRRLAALLHHVGAPHRSNMGRFTLPACFNYLQILGESKSSLTAFIGKLNLIPVFGEGFPNLFPIIFGLVLVCKLLNLHGKALHLMGLIEEKRPGASKWKELVTEGRKAIYRQQFLTKCHGSMKDDSTEDARNNSV